MSCAAVEATLDRLAALDYEGLQQRGDDLRAFIETTFAAEGVSAKTSGYGTVFSIWFADQTPTEYETAARLADPQRSLSLHLELRRHGLLVMPSAYGRLYLSFAHGAEAMEITRNAFVQAARTMAS